MVLDELEKLALEFGFKEIWLSTRRINQKAAVEILNLNTGESYSGRLAITGTNQLYLPVEIQKMLQGSGRIRVRLL